MVGALRIAMDAKRRMGGTLLLGKKRRPLDGDVLGSDRLHPLDGTVVAVLAELREFLRIVDGEDMIDGDVDDHHEDELEASVACGREDAVGDAHLLLHVADGGGELDDGVGLLGIGVALPLRVEHDGIVDLSHLAIEALHLLAARERDADLLLLPLAGAAPVGDRDT